MEIVRKSESQQRLPNLSLDADSIHSYDQIYLLLNYRVESDLSANLTGRASLRIRANESFETFPLNAENLLILGVSRQGTPLDFTHAEDTLWVSLSLLPGEIATVDIDLEAPVVPSFFEVGYHADFERVFTFAEPYGARRWFPCWDQPYDKFDSIRVAVNMPDHWSLASNGRLESTTYPETGRKRETYSHRDPISSYLVMIAAGLYSKRVEEVGGISYRYITYPEDSADAAIDWALTPDMTDLYSDLCGDYPFDAYGMVQAGIFNGWGAMEHQTFTTYGWRLVNGERSFEGIVAHELAHQWFGDHLSPVDFRNMWLNEGFATYYAAVWFEHLYGYERLQLEMDGMRQTYLQEDDEFRYAAYDPPPDYLFGNVIYQKSGFILYMLRAQLLGDSLFNEVIREYVDRFAGGNVDTEDFIEVVNDVSGEDYRWFFDQWIYAAGHPELIIGMNITGHPEQEFGDLMVTVQQVQNNAPLFRFPLTVEGHNENGWYSQTLWFDAVAGPQTRNATYWHLDGGRLADFQPLLYEPRTSSVDDADVELPTAIELLPTYPNPFNSMASIPFEISTRTRVNVSVYNLNGQLVQQIIDAAFNAGPHTVTFAAPPSLGSGVYIVRLSAGDVSQTRKLVFLK